MKRANHTKIRGFNGVWGDSAPCRPAPEASRGIISREVIPAPSRSVLRALKAVCMGLRHARNARFSVAVRVCRDAFRKLAVLVPLQVILTRETFSRNHHKTRHLQGVKIAN